MSSRHTLIHSSFAYQRQSRIWYHRLGHSVSDFLISQADRSNVLICSGAACEAALEGFPSVAFSGSSTAQESYTKLTTNSNSATVKAAELNAQLTATFTQTLLASSSQPILPSGVTLNVNYPITAHCPRASDFKWVLTRVTSNSSAVDVQTCGSDHLPTETSVITAGSLGGCFASVSVISASTKTDVDAATQSAVLESLSALPFSCFSL